MNIKETIATIKLTPHGEIPGLANVNISMLIWVTKQASGRFMIYIPLLGDLQTYATSQSDIDVAMQEAVECFFIATKKHGEGLLAELIKLGWEVQGNKRRARFRKPKSKVIVPEEANELRISGGPAIQAMANTGIRKTMQVSV